MPEGQSTVTGRVHKRLVTVLIVLASLVATVGVFAVWLDRQALNTDEWTSTSGKLLENSKVRGVPIRVPLQRRPLHPRRYGCEPVARASRSDVRVDGVRART